MIAPELSQAAVIVKDEVKAGETDEVKEIAEKKDEVSTEAKNTPEKPKTAEPKKEKKEVTPVKKATPPPSGFDATWEKELMAMKDLCKEGLKNMEPAKQTKFMEDKVEEDLTKQFKIYAENSAAPTESIILRKMKCV